MYREPVSSFELWLWKWKDVQDAIVQAGQVVGLETVSRRVIRLCSPSKGTTMGDGVFARLKHLNIELKSGRRHTSSTVYHVFRGKGATVIDNTRYQWESGDSLSVPLWRFHHHESLSTEPAVLFVMSNKPALSALGYYREEMA